MKSLTILLIITLCTLSFAQDQSITLGSIDFYGYAGLDTGRVRAALPLREGDKLSRESRDKTVESLRQAVKQASGREPSDVATLCCDERGRLLIYIGFQHRDRAGDIRYNPAPHGSIRLPSEAIKLYTEAEEALTNAVARGVSGQEASQGYALSVDPQARARQMALHDYAARNAALLRRVLKSAADAEQRRLAAEMVGYTGRSQAQVDALLRASHDVDDIVRNNAMRALGVLAQSSRSIAAGIPAESFIKLLSSGIWTDRNKSAFVLSALTQRRDPRLLARLRAEALGPLIEMSRWHSPTHASTPRLILGRVAGIDEKDLAGMIERGEVEQIIEALSSRKK
ncbi:MAG TPA: hypothetical protein VF735_04760 [Pyrinomonadaceae bacterium]|jgi:hypothetical protein